MTDPIGSLRARGFVHGVTDEDGLRRLLATERVTFYVGFDPTAASLHIGHLMGMMAMAWLQRAGHRPIAVAGGGTGRIGDPSFRDEERELLDEDRLRHNLEGIRGQLARVLDLDDGLLLDNYDWLGRFGFIEFLRDVGKHFSVNAMIARESVRRRLEEREHGISFTEFAYQLLQAYDFAHLYAAHGCRLQAGGSDQWGNITAGIDLTRRLHGGQVYGLVWPLVERSDGRKFSKSTGEAVWLDAGLTSPYAFYQWFFNVPDDDAAHFLRLFTFLPLEDIAALEDEQQRDPAARPGPARPGRGGHPHRPRRGGAAGGAAGEPGPLRRRALRRPRRPHPGRRLRVGALGRPPPRPPRRRHRAGRPHGRGRGRPLPRRGPAPGGAGRGQRQQPPRRRRPRPGRARRPGRRRHHRAAGRQEALLPGPLRLSRSAPPACG